MGQTLLEVRNLVFSYHQRTVIDSISLSLEKGRFFGLIGPNGSGKSTLIKLLSGYLLPSHGSVKLEGRPLADYTRRHIATKIGVVPQNFSFPFPYTVEEFIRMGRYPYEGLLGKSHRDDDEVVTWAMDQTDVGDLAHRSVMELSGGEKQRVVLAGALAQKSDILLLDEPTSSLDLRHQVHIYNVLRRLNNEHGLTIIAVTHDLNLGSQFCDTILLLDKGRIAAQGEPKTLITPTTVERYFGISVLSGRHPDTDRPFVVPQAK